MSLGSVLALEVVMFVQREKGGGGGGMKEKKPPLVTTCMYSDPMLLSHGQ